ncbi:S-adenosylmethionine sensor upstream of mTORC1 [Battus philenor]|uniref:S-adenosylmethionine sensor upstream of mTORC1 n=1 Tax=Battus philenor TaxID=42288 RepID=UPI0035CF6123
MATEEHKQLAQYIKEVHSSLRKCSYELGVQKAWFEHCENKEVLTTYAKCMEKLATVHWENNCDDKSNTATSRIQWSTDFCYDYYVNKGYLKFCAREKDISQKINIKLDKFEHFTLPLKLLDVGSCYNPFKKYEFFNVLPIDLYPANNSVYQCDFLKLEIGEKNILEHNNVKQLKQDSYDIVTFCFLLEYIPHSDLRIEACIKAYKLLKPGGLLIINTPDSKHVGANAKLMKNWQYTLACIGFSRIKYEKFKHMHCLAYRKCLHKEIAARWATLYKQPFMEYKLNIPQDFLCENDNEILVNYTAKSDDSYKTTEHFAELPFNSEIVD